MAAGPRYGPLAGADVEDGALSAAEAAAASSSADEAPRGGSRTCSSFRPLPAWRPLRLVAGPAALLVAAALLACGALPARTTRRAGNAAAAVELAQFNGRFEDHHGKFEVFKTPKAAFASIDFDGDGVVTLDEVLVWAPAHNFTKRWKVERGFKLVDANGDGQMTLDEWMHFWQRDVDRKVQEEGPEAVALQARLKALAAQEGKANILTYGAERLKFANTSNLGVRSPGPRAGTVYLLYTYGGPGTAYPPLRNPLREDGCWSGLRVYTESVHEMMLGMSLKVHDPITFISYVASFEHAPMDAMAARLHDPESPGKDTCGENLNEWPEIDSYLMLNLHKSRSYQAGLQVQSNDPLARVMSHLCTIAYANDLEQAAAASLKYGWNVVGQSVAPDYKGDTNPDTTYLFQEPESLDCAVVFRGTDDVSDAMADVSITPVKFCGLADDEDMEHAFVDRQKIKAGNSLVHEGFANELRHMIRTDSFAEQIRAKLPKCKRVIVSGHSLGGAEAELFSACVHRAPPEGTEGYEDYARVMWEPATPERLPELVSPVPIGGEQIDNLLQECPTDTKGTCLFMGCNKGRGPADCVNMKCICRPGYCNVAGTCMPQESLLKG